MLCVLLFVVFFFIFSFLSLFFVSDSFSLWDFGTSHFRLFFLWFVEVGAAIKSGQQLMAPKATVMQEWVMKMKRVAFTCPDARQIDGKCN